MFQPNGHALQSCVVALTALSFMQIGFDNGLMGGLGSSNLSCSTITEPHIMNHLTSLASNHRLLQQNIQYSIPDYHLSHRSHL